MSPHDISEEHLRVEANSPVVFTPRGRLTGERIVRCLISLFISHFSLYQFAINLVGLQCSQRFLRRQL